MVLGRGVDASSDMVFTVRQLIEKANEHKVKIFFMFIDLRKAYNSVPHEALWVALSKLGVPDTLIELIQSFHQDMKATIRLDSTLLEIRVENGLRQGCCMAPALFNLYASLVVQRGSTRMKNAGVRVHLYHKPDGKLFRRYLRNAHESCLTECQFADDVAILATSRAGAERALQGYIEVARDFGLTVSIPKTKIMASGRTVQHSDEGPIELDDNNYIEAVTKFQYLGSLVERSGRVDTDIERRVMQASRAFGCLH